MTENGLMESSETEKLFYNDSHLKKFTATVLECRPAEEKEKQGKQEKQEKKEKQILDVADSEKAGTGAVKSTASTYEVILDRTAFFPEGGGQYADRGVLGGVHVLDVHERGGHVLHITDGPLTPGETVEGTLDWEERFMKMQQHTGEHIVSGLVHARYGYNNVGFHLGSEDCTMDFDGEIPSAELEEIELEANSAVWQNLEIQTLYPSKAELAEMDYRSKLEIEGQVRVVVVPGYDSCACCAPHVAFTGEIGLIKLTNMQRYKGGVRVTMLCGVRALADYAMKQKQTKKISAFLCAKENETAEAVEHLKEEITELKSRIAEKERQLIAVQASMIPAEEQTVCIFSDDLAGDGMRLMMNAVMEQERFLCAVFYGNDSDGYRYVIGSKKVDLRPVTKEMNVAFEGRGGGKPEMVQGTLKGTEKELRGWILKKAEELQNEQ